MYIYTYIYNQYLVDMAIMNKIIMITIAVYIYCVCTMFQTVILRTLCVLSHLTLMIAIRGSLILQFAGKQIEP